MKVTESGAHARERQGLDPVATYGLLTRRHQAPRPQPPFNDAARRLAGFSEEELAQLAGGG